MGKSKTEKTAESPAPASKFNVESILYVELPSNQLVPLRGCIVGGATAPPCEVATIEPVYDARAALEKSGRTVITLAECIAMKAAGEFGGNEQDDTDPAQGYALIDAAKSKALYQTTKNG